ncbi:hypothetical protein [Aeromonas salmonicida]|nr:hypothetical protein [Aeromonas salmonicida]
MANSSRSHPAKFAEPVEPRVFITYAGTMDNVITLAHELGH